MCPPRAPGARALDRDERLAARLRSPEPHQLRGRRVQLGERRHRALVRRHEPTAPENACAMICDTALASCKCAVAGSSAITWRALDGASLAA
jgi:hypothetical protein